MAPLRVTTRLAVAALAALAGLTLATCASEPDSREVAGEAPVVVRDSAGVRIVESRAPAWTDGEAWTVAANADRILDGGGTPDFALFRVVDLALLPDGAIAVANQGAAEVAVLEADGRMRRRYGRAGDGPGEFRYLNGVLTRGDSVVAVDGATLRFSVFAPTGELAREFSVPSEPGRPTGIRSVDMGAAGVGVFRELGFAEKLQPGVMRLPGTAFRLAWDGARAAEFPGDFPGGAIFVAADGMGTLPLGPDLWMAGSSEGLMVGDGESPELRRYGPDGSLEGLLRWSVPVRPVTEGIRDEWLADQRAGLEESLASAPPEARAQAMQKQRAFQESIPFPEHLPIHTDLRVDDTGHLWVRVYRSHLADEGPVSWQGKRIGPDTPPEQVPDLWWIFDGEGQWLGTVTTPPGLRVRRVTRDAVWGIHRDALGVETVRRHPLNR